MQSIRSSPNPCAIAILGMILLGSRASAAPGDFDPSFGGTGAVLSDLGSATTVAIDPKGRIVVAGSDVVRYEPDGRLDTTFGIEGVARLDRQAEGLVLQPDGKLVVAARDERDGRLVIRLTRLTADGFLDETFGSGGTLTIADDTTDETTLTFGRLLVLADGRLLLVGTSCDEGDDFCSFTLVRRDADGTVDTSFGNQGLVRTPFPMDFVSAEDAVLQPDGHLVIAGRGFTIHGPVAILARYEATGRLDVTFGDGGRLVSSLLADQRRALVHVALAPDGKLVVAINAGAVFLARFLADGAIDEAFGDAGIVPAPSAAASGVGNSLAVLPDGRIVVAGATSTIIVFDWLLAAYLPTGEADVDFGTDGLVTASFGLQGDRASALALQPDGRLVVVGSVGDAPGFAVARFLGPRRRCGDADGDAHITVSDGVQVLRAAADLPSSCLPAHCDADGNGQVTVSDGVQTLRAAADLPADLRCS